MSRVGKKPVKVPSGVEVKIDDGTVSVKGPKGQLETRLHDHVSVTHEGDEVTVAVKDIESGKDQALWGLFRSLIANMVTGVTKGFQKKLEINGVGFKVAVQGRVLKLDVGYSHSVDFKIPEGIDVSVEKNVITVSGIDKQQVGEIAAQIRKVRKPEPYKGKGIKYEDEVVRRKAGKAAKAGTAA